MDCCLEFLEKLMAYDHLALWLIIILMAAGALMCIILLVIATFLWVTLCLKILEEHNER